MRTSAPLAVGSRAPRPARGSSSIARSVWASVVGLRPSTRTAESPRPMAQTVRLPNMSLSVANTEAVTVGSRLTGFVTSGPTIIRSVAAEDLRVDDVGLLPQDVGVERPGVREAVALGAAGRARSRARPAGRSAASGRSPPRSAPRRRAAARPVDRAERQLVQRADRQLEVLDRRVLLLGVAQPAEAAHEHHHGRHHARHLGRVVQRAARQRGATVPAELARSPRRRSRPARASNGIGSICPDWRSHSTVAALLGGDPLATPRAPRRASRRARPRRARAGRASTRTCPLNAVTIPGATVTLPVVARTSSPAQRVLAAAPARCAPRPGRRRGAGPSASSPAWACAPVKRTSVALDAERAAHRAERQVDALEHRPLLDVQLEVGRRRRRARRRRSSMRSRSTPWAASASGSATPSRSRRPRTPSGSSVPARGAGADQAAPEAGALLVGPVDQPQRSAAGVGRRRERAQHLERGDDVRARRRASRRRAPSRCGRRR